MAVTGSPRARKVLALMVLGHVLLHGSLLQVKIGRDRARAAAYALFADRAAEAARKLPAGGRLVVTVTPETELRWWPLKAELLAGEGRQVEAVALEPAAALPAEQEVLDLRSVPGGPAATPPR